MGHFCQLVVQKINRLAYLPKNLIGSKKIVNNKIHNRDFVHDSASAKDKELQLCPKLIGRSLK